MSGRYYCPNCKATLDYQTGFSPSRGTHVCTRCGMYLSDPDAYHGDIFEDVSWFCDNCGAFLNTQDGFTDLDGYWDCTACGYVNTISQDEIQENKVKQRESAYVRTLNVFNTFLDKQIESMSEKNASGTSPIGSVQHQEDKMSQFLEKAVSALFKGIFWILKMIGKLIIFILKEIFNLLKRAVHYFIDPQKDGRISKIDFAKIRIKAFLFNRKLLPINNDCYDLLHKKVDKVKVILYNNGFKNIKAIPIKDLGPQNVHRIGEVEQVVINGTSFFESDDMFRYDTQIIVTYHKKYKSRKKQ